MVTAYDGPEILLYEAPTDYNSCVTRMMLIEKGATYTSKFVDEEKLENYEPWYLKINAKATLPTLVCGEIVLTDPKAIVEYIQQLSCGRPLKPPADSYMSKRYESLVEEHFQQNIESFTLLYQMEVSGWTTEGGSLKTSDRIYRAIRKLDAMIASKQEEAPLLAAAQRLVEEHRRLLWELKFSDEIFVGQIMELYGAFDLLETQLEKNEHANMFDSLICGPDEDSFTTCDALWMCLLARAWWCKFTRRALQARSRSWAYWKQIKERASFKAVFAGNVFGPQIADEQPELRGTILEEELKNRPLGGYIDAWQSQIQPTHYHSFQKFKVFTSVATVREGPEMSSPVVGEVKCKTVVTAVEEYVIPVDHCSWAPSPIRLKIEKPVAGWISLKAVKSLEDWDAIAEPGPLEGSEYYADISGWLGKQSRKRAYMDRRQTGFKYYATALKNAPPNYYTYRQEFEDGKPLECKAIVR